MFAIMDSRNWELAETLINEIGAETLIDEILKWMDSDSANDCLDDIATNYDIR